jgi:hypothetical protein
VLDRQGAVLKPNMVKNGLTGPKAPPETVAALTVAALLRTVPPAMPGIFFLSGETTLDEDNEETATINLNAMHAPEYKLPWSVSFSYGKALQKTCIVTWMGKAENNVAAQTALLNRAKANSEAVFGKCAPHPLHPIDRGRPPACGSAKRPAQPACTRLTATRRAAERGRYVKGSCASIGAEGNVEMAGGAY